LAHYFILIVMSYWDGKKKTANGKQYTAQQGQYKRED